MNPISSSTIPANSNGAVTQVRLYLLSRYIIIDHENSKLSTRQEGYCNEGEGQLRLGRKISNIRFNKTNF
jgi:hypothetical protein